MGNVAETIELRGDVTRAAAQVVHRIIAIDTHVGSRAGHQLGQTVCANRA